MKNVKFDPIALLDRLNPVINETVCETTARVLINVASALDCDTTDDMGIELVRNNFGAPEIRSFQQQVLKKMGIVQKEKDAQMTPSMALFLRVKCAMTVESTTVPSSTKADTISDIITDIPTLCNLLNAHLDKLIAFNNRDEDDEMDEDEAIAFEDDQNFICLQLIHMAKASELEEEGSRRHFISIMRSMLSRLETPDDLVDACVKAMAAAHDTEAQFVQTISEVLVDVEDDDTFNSVRERSEKTTEIVRQMRVIAILSIVLENISGRMVGHPILDGFFEHLSPAITSKNAVIREHGVVCLSKFCLLTEEDKVMGQFKPLLMTIAGSVEERVEVRAQAALALCDMALLHDKTLESSDVEGEDDSTLSFKDMLLEMLGHSKPGIVIIAAEITAKLLLAGRFHDPNLVAWLLTVFFDASLTENHDAEENGAEVKEVGSPVRLQQLLSIFFPTYSMSHLDANDAVMASVGPLLSIINEKLGGAKSAKALNKWPITKIVEFICYTVDLADKKKNAEVETENDEPENDRLAEPTEVGPLSKSSSDKKEVIEASSTLLASIDIAEFLSESCDSAPTYYNRALAKILASASIDVDNEDKTLLSRLKSQVSEAEYANADGPTLTAIGKLTNLLADVDDRVFSEDEESASEEEVEEEERSVPEDDSEEVEKSVQSDDSFADALEEEDGVMEKENSRMSIGSFYSAKAGNDEGRRMSCASRISLGSVN